MHFHLWVSSRSLGGAIRLIRCPPNLRVAFNKIISEVQGGEAPLTDLELTHYRKRIPRRKKNKKSAIISSPIPNFGFSKPRDNNKTEGSFFFFDRLHAPFLKFCMRLQISNLFAKYANYSYNFAQLYIFVNNWSIILAL